MFPENAWILVIQTRVERLSKGNIMCARDGKESSREVETFALKTSQIKAYIGRMKSSQVGMPTCFLIRSKQIRLGMLPVSTGWQGTMHVHADRWVDTENLLNHNLHR